MCTFFFSKVRVKNKLGEKFKCALEACLYIFTKTKSLSLLEVQVEKKE